MGFFSDLTKPKKRTYTKRTYKEKDCIVEFHPEFLFDYNNIEDVEYIEC